LPSDLISIDESTVKKNMELWIDKYHKQKEIAEREKDAKKFGL